MHMMECNSLFWFGVFVITVVWFIREALVTFISHNSRFDMLTLS